MKCLTTAVALFSVSLGSSAIAAQVTAADYARAERQLPANARALVFRDSVVPNWIGGSDRFWYRVRTPRGTEFIYVDPARRVRRPAFDQQRIAVALGRAADTTLHADSLPFPPMTWEERDQRDAIVVELRKRSWRCELTRYSCDAVATPKKAAPGEALSPDGKSVAFVRDFNLWVRSLETGRETQLTTDGIHRYDYATAPESRLSFVTEARLGIKAAPMVLWSPDSKRILTHRLDQRGLPEMHLIQSVRSDGVLRPKLWSYVYSIVGDTAIAKAEWLIFEVADGRRVSVNAPPITMKYVSPIWLQEAWWNPDATTAYYIEYERGQRAFWLKHIDAATGAVRTVLEERGPTMVRTHKLLGGKPNVWVSRNGADVVSFSERDGWGHLYRFDGVTGRPQQQITRGNFVVRDLLAVDEQRRRLYLTIVGREPGRDPYYRHLYSVDLDGGGLRLLTPEDADHAVALSPTRAWAVDQYSRVDQAPITVLRSTDGNTVLPLESADISRLLGTGWRYPERFTVKAADGTTDLYGILLRPARFDSTRKYPVVEEIYPGPQTTQVPKWFTAGSDLQAIVELGFVGVELDGRGTTLRSKAFHDYSYGRLETGGGLEDHVAGYRQLAGRYPFLDLDRVGIYGHSGGGFASTRALLMYPDFYKVAVSSAGNHDQRGYISFWGELYHGLLEGDNYVAQANPTLAKNLRGKLLLAFGDMDDNVPPALTVQLIDALTKANRDYDLLIVPNGNHGFGANSYFKRRRWDYFVRHLLGKDPPPNYEITTR